MRVLAIDTATEALSVALLDSRGLLARRFAVIGRGHAEQVLPWVHQVLAEAGWALTDIGGIAVSRGPGAFTGVRIGISAAQGLAFGLAIPVFGLSTLEAVAAGAALRAAENGVVCDTVVAALDARMGEVYAASARIAGDAVRLEWEALCAPSQLAVKVGSAGSTVLAGHGFSAYPDCAEGFRSVVASYPDVLPDAAVIGRLAYARLAAGEGVDAAALEPVYLRDEVATRSKR
jgi:tRNA threonylcarbamoyladenosine biosynthesis protein TsaB